MYYGNIKFCDISNGIGVRTSLFVSGCRNACEDCFNRETWSFTYGKQFNQEVERQIIYSLAPDYIDGLTILGGEPFEPENQQAVLDLIKKLKAEYPQKSVWIYSGFTYEELKDGSRAATPIACEILAICDVLVDGRFDKNCKNISLRFRGSENQRIIDLKKTGAVGKIVLWDWQ